MPAAAAWRARKPADPLSEGRRWRSSILALIVLNILAQASHQALDSGATIGAIAWVVGALALLVLFAGVVIIERRNANRRWPSATRTRFRLIDMPSLTPGELGRWGRWRRGWAAHDA